MFSLIYSLLITAVALFLLERMVMVDNQPRTYRLRRGLLSVVPHLVLYLTLLMLTYRPFFAGSGVISIFAAIVMLNNTKFRTLREPLVYADFALLTELVRHPTLYIKYIGVWRIVLGSVLMAVLIGGSLVLDQPLIDRVRPFDWLPTVVYIGTVVGLIYAIVWGPLRRVFINLLKQYGPTLDLSRDISSLSMLVCLICYFFLTDLPAPALRKRHLAMVERDLRNRTGHRLRLRPPSIEALLPSVLPHIVVMQNESFFDARRLGEAVPDDLLSAFDALCGEARFRGQLKVPAWGANTMRTEHAFLTGLPNEAMGGHRFNPYRLSALVPTWSIIHVLSLLGYEGICVHPFDPAFFGRDKVFSNLGFSRFLGIGEFEDAKRFGPYVSDVAVSEKVAEVLERAERPTFVFAITMENHGNWLPGRLDNETPSEVGLELPFESQEFGCYLRHLRNADRSFSAVAEALHGGERPGIFCLYGDHMPSFPEVFRAAEFDESETDYLVWATTPGASVNANVAVESLGQLVIQSALSINLSEVSLPQVEPTVPGKKAGGAS